MYIHQVWKARLIIHASFFPYSLSGDALFHALDIFVVFPMGIDQMNSARRKRNGAISIGVFGIFVLMVFHVAPLSGDV